MADRSDMSDKPVDVDLEGMGNPLDPSGPAAHGSVGEARAMYSTEAYLSLQPIFGQPMNEMRCAHHQQTTGDGDA